MDVLAYLVVLGVFIQLFPVVISETFLLALLTAILLKVVLELVALAFGDAVRLGGFLQVTALIVFLMVARGGTRRLFPPDVTSKISA